LIARQAIGGRVAVVLSVQRGNAEAPVYMVRLHRVGQPLEIDYGLIELSRIRRVHICCRPVAARLHRVGADVAADIDPTVDLDVRGIQRFAELGVGERHHQRAIHGVRPGHADARRATIRPFRVGIGRRALRRRRPAGPAARWRGWVGRRAIMSPFERVVIDEAGPKIVADAFVPIRRVGRGLPRHGSIVACGSDRDHRRRQYSVASLRRGARKQRHGDDTSDGPHDCPLCPLQPMAGFGGL